MKKLLCIFFSCVFLFSFTSCAFIDRLQGDMSQLEYDEDGHLLYKGNAYYRADNRFEVRTSTNDKVIELGWQSQFPFFPDMHYYAFDEEDPLFIFCDNGESTLYNKGLYVRSDYDFYNEVYAVENTDIEIALSMFIWLGIKEILHMLLNIAAELVHLTAGISLSNEYKINFVLWMAVV